MVHLNIRVLKTLPEILEPKTLYITKGDDNSFLELTYISKDGGFSKRLINKTEARAVIEPLIPSDLSFLADENHTHLIDNVNLLADELNLKQPLGDYVEREQYNLTLDTIQNKLYNTSNIKSLNNISLLGSDNISFKTILNESIFGTGNIELGIHLFTVTSVNLMDGDVVLTKADVGLNNVDNISDVNKPISITFQNVIDTKTNLTGGILTGSLFLHGNAIEPNEALPKQQLDTIITSVVNALIDKSFLVKKEGDSLTGPLELYSNASNMLEAVPLQQLESISVLDRDRSNHTGTQSIGTVDELQNSIDSKEDILNEESLIKTIHGINILSGGNIDISHSDLINLDEDDHLQYFTEYRADLRYIKSDNFKTAVDSIIVDGTNISTVKDASTTTIEAGNIVSPTTSVNLKTGDVIINASDLNADSLNTTTNLIYNHVISENPHVFYLKTNSIIEDDNIDLIVDENNKNITIKASVEASVNSVNLKTGDVIITASDLNASSANEAQTAINTHKTANDHDQYFNTTTANIIYKTLNHTHTTNQIKNLTNTINNILESSIIGENNININYDNYENNLQINTNYKVTNKEKEYKYRLVNNAAVNENFVFKLSTRPRKYDVDTFILKEVLGSTGVIRNQENFNTINKSNYTCDNRIIFDGNLKVNKSETGNLELKTTYYEKELNNIESNIEIKISNLGIIPKFTSSTSVNGFSVSASSSWSSSYEAWKAFNGDITGYDCWASSSTPDITNPQWLKVSLPEDKSITGYSITTRALNNNSPKDWELQGSNDNINWVTIHSNIGNQNNTTPRTDYYYFDETQPYKYYRLFITKTVINQFVTIGEFKLFNKINTNILGNDSVYYTVIDGTLTALSTPFEQNLTSSGIINKEDLELISPFKIISDSQINYEIVYYSPAMLIQNDLTDFSDVKNINNVQIVKTPTGGGEIYIAVRTTLNGNYFVYKNNEWVDIGSLTLNYNSANKLLSQGMTSSYIYQLTATDWEKLYKLNGYTSFKKLAFAYAVYLPNPTTDDLIVDSINITVDNNGYWTKASAAQVETYYHKNSIEYKVLISGNYIFAYQDIMLPDTIFTTDVGTDTSPILELEEGYNLIIT